MKSQTQDRFGPECGCLAGFCHLGVLQVLREEDIPVDYLAGTSIGALIRAFYAANFDLAFMSRVAQHLKVRHIADPIFPGKGYSPVAKRRTF